MLQSKDCASHEKGDKTPTPRAGVLIPLLNIHRSVSSEKDRPGESRSAGCAAHMEPAWPGRCSRAQEMSSNGRDPLSQEDGRGGRILPGIDVEWGLKGRIAFHHCINSKAKAKEAFTENECGIKAKPHIFKAGGIDAVLAFCGDGSTPCQVTDGDVIPCSDGWQCGRETIFHCTLLNSCIPPACPSTSKLSVSPRHALINHNLSGLMQRTTHSETPQPGLRRSPD